MKEVNLSWVGSEDSAEGMAHYSREGVRFLTLDLPSFKHAHAISLALDTAIKAGYYEGVKEAEVAMKNAMRGLVK